MLNISKQIYTGWDHTKVSKYPLPEAEIIPLGESLNEKKKLESLVKKYNILKEHDNIPLPGFTLYKTDKKNFGSIENTWLVIDPRGFLVRITSENLEKILIVTGITEGLIQEKCIWAREDSQTKMTLVPVNSDEYLNAVKNTEIIESKVDIKDVNIGDTVIMQNGLQGIYRGTLSLYGPIVERYNDLIAKPQVFLRRQIVEIDPMKFYFQTDVKILKVIKETEQQITREESAKYLNNQIQAGAIFTVSPRHSTRYYSTIGMIRHVSVHAVQKPKISLVEIDKIEAENIFKSALVDGDNFRLILESDNPKKHDIVNFPFPYSSISGCSVNSFNVLKVSSLFNNENIQLLEKVTYQFGRTAPGNHSLDNFTKFYKIVKFVKNETYV